MAGAWRGKAGTSIASLKRPDAADASWPLQFNFVVATNTRRPWRTLVPSRGFTRRSAASPVLPAPAVSDAVDAVPW